jgi:3-isopropylmalate/(R)-2-methylmalate dehydratase large subunit
MTRAAEKEPGKASPASIIEKIWRQHIVTSLTDEMWLLHMDRIFLHERSGGRMLQGVAAAGRPVFDPHLVFGTMDHIIDTDPGRGDATKFPGGAEFIQTFRDEAKRADIPVFDIGDAKQGIVHVIAPELGIALPGMTLVCGDSHTCTMGGISALSWGIGITQGEHALSTQCLPVKLPKLMRVRFEGLLASGVTAKDLILHLIGAYGADGGEGHAVEFTGPVVEAMSCAGRMTLCNMAAEFGAWTGIVAPDATTLAYLKERDYAPKGPMWDRAAAHWLSLCSDEDAVFDKEIVINCNAIGPQVTWGTSSQQVINIDEIVPDPASAADPVAQASGVKAVAYTDIAPGQSLLGLPIEAAFIGSCTNSRIEDLRESAALLKGRKVAAGVKAICVPGSTHVKHLAEKEGLDKIFIEAGFEWRESGCSLCFYAGGDNFGEARRVISSTNRNFENRQGPGVRTHLASPLTVAASAIAGKIADPRNFKN